MSAARSLWGGELNLLRAGLANAHGGKGGAMAILGAAGMGKTRLLRELSHQAAEEGMRVLEGRASPAGTSTAFRPVTEALLAGLRGELSPLDGALA